MAARKSTLRAEALEKLGARRLAELLMEIAGGNAAIKRWLKLEVVAVADPGSLAKEVRKRLAQIERSRGFLEWDKTRALAADLDTQRRTIAEKIANIDTGEALELMWRFMELADSIYNRCDDSNGDIGDVFRAACANLGALAEAARPDPIILADRAYAAFLDNGYAQYDHLIEALAPALGDRGLDHLKTRFIALSKAPAPKPEPGKRKVIGWGMSGPLYEDEIKESSRKRVIEWVLREIADLQGDVDGFIAQYEPETRKAPKIAAEVAERLIAAGRAQEALDILDAAEHRRGRDEDLWFLPDFAWDDARISALDVLGQAADAQAARLACFERSLSKDHLKAYLERLPDFDDVEAEARALDFVEKRKRLTHALHFLVQWPALDRAARMVEARAKELDGNAYEVFTPAAEALAAKFPRAATLLLRAMIDYTMGKARSSRYRHAARHFMECASLAGQIADFGPFETHATYIVRLKKEHGRKAGFWSLVS